MSQSFEDEPIDIEKIRLPKDLFPIIGYKRLKGGHKLRGDDWEVHFGEVVNQVEKHSWMEVDEVGKLVTLYLEIFIDPAFVDEEKEKLIGLAHPFFLAVFDAIDVKGEKLYIAISREHQESLGLALA